MTESHKILMLEFEQFSIDRLQRLAEYIYTEGHSDHSITFASIMTVLARRMSVQQFDTFSKKVGFTENCD